MESRFRLESVRDSNRKQEFLFVPCNSQRKPETLPKSLHSCIPLLRTSFFRPKLVWLSFRFNSGSCHEKFLQLELRRLSQQQCKRRRAVNLPPRLRSVRTKKKKLAAEEVAAAQKSGRTGLAGKAGRLDLATAAAVDGARATD